MRSYCWFLFGKFCTSLFPDLLKLSAEIHCVFTQPNHWWIAYGNLHYWASSDCNLELVKIALRFLYMRCRSRVLCLHPSIIQKWKAFSGVVIEDLPIPLHCIFINLAKHRAFISTESKPVACSGKTHDPWNKNSSCPINLLLPSQLCIFKNACALCRWDIGAIPSSYLESWMYQSVSLKREENAVYPF